jgi:hypothetical protein
VSLQPWGNAPWNCWLQRVSHLHQKRLCHNGIMGKL